MKKLVASILCLVLMITSFAFAAEVFEKPEFNILVNGVEVDKTDVPIVIEGRTLVPLRTLAVALGVPNTDENIKWDGEKRQVTVIDEYFSIVLYIDSNVAWVNGEEKLIDVPATIYNGRTYLPARFVAESFDKYVGWDGATGTITISDEPIAVVEPLTKDAASIFKKAQEAMSSVESLKTDMYVGIDMNVQGMPITAELDGSISADMNKNQVYGDLDFVMQMFGMEMPAEMYMYMDNAAMYMRTVAEGEDSGWVNAANESDIAMADIWAMIEQAETAGVPEEFYSAFEIAEVDGEYTVLTVKDDLVNNLGTVIKQLVDEQMTEEVIADANLDISKLDYKLYVNNNTNYIDKMEMMTTINVEAEGETVSMNLDLIMNMSEFNTVKITKPAM